MLRMSTHQKKLFESCRSCGSVSLNKLPTSLSFLPGRRDRENENGFASHPWIIRGWEISEFRSDIMMGLYCPPPPEGGKEVP
jgi:hypothetical protein